ncbi:hypothetical protein Ddc_19794 [Ditylenchus destructor]|nr:hypothetical protein Ddc_19794 [Ditylenchus destructor]
MYLPLSRRPSKIEIYHVNCNRIGAEDFQPILNSPTILQCRKLYIHNAHFSFKDYKVLYTVNAIDIYYGAEEEVDHSYWTEFLEQPGVKPIVALQYARHEDNVNAVECFKKVI